MEDQTVSAVTKNDFTYRVILYMNTVLSHIRRSLHNMPFFSYDLYFASNMANMAW